MKTLPIPKALYPCKHCASEYSWPAEDLRWSEKERAWVCRQCWYDDVHGEPGTRLWDEIAMQDAIKHGPGAI